MLFPTFIFFAFFIPVLALNWFLKRWPLAWKLFLLAVSYYFYATWDVRFLFVLLSLTLWSFLLTSCIVKVSARKTVLGIVIAGDIITLLMFKYYDFFRTGAESLLAQFGFSANFPLLDFLLPVGLSFYTLRAISYSIEAYRGTIAPSISLLDYSIYLSFFPQLLSGPIARPQHFLPQLQHGGATRITDIHCSFGFILNGLFKKVVLASYFGVIADNVFAIPHIYSTLEVLGAVYAYAIVIYCDFSGYSDMAIGIAGLMGFISPQNFSNPYFSTSIQEFWRRWHISFSEWLRDYVYISLGGNRKGRIRQAMNTLVTMLVSGLWHGVGINYLIWGFIHGIGLIAQQTWKRLRNSARQPGRIGVIVAWFVTLNFISFAWIFFRTDTPHDAFAVFSALNGNVAPLTATALISILFGIGAFAYFFLESRLLHWYTKFQEKHNIVIQAAVMVLLVFAIIELGPSLIPPFIYFKF